MHTLTERYTFQLSVIPPFVLTPFHSSTSNSTYSPFNSSNPFTHPLFPLPSLLSLPLLLSPYNIRNRHTTLSLLKKFIIQNIYMKTMHTPSLTDKFCTKHYIHIQLKLKGFHRQFTWKCKFTIDCPHVP